MGICLIFLQRTKLLTNLPYAWPESVRGLAQYLQPITISYYYSSLKAECMFERRAVWTVLQNGCLPLTFPASLAFLYVLSVIRRRPLEMPKVAESGRRHTLNVPS